MPGDRIIHLDADAFFASVEQASDSRLRGRPVAVGGEKRGIIASASYEARRYGVYTPMPTVRARRLCPQLVVLPGDYEKYERFSQWMFSYAYDFTPDVEVTSIDEGYFDLTGVRRDAVDVARTIRDAIRQSLKITVSEGIGSSKLVSQIASKLHKPQAFHAVPSGEERVFLHPLANQWLPGVGPKLSARLNAAGLARIGQIASTPVDLLELVVGSVAPGLRQYANGIDGRPIIPARAPAKSYSQQETFERDQTDEVFLEATLRRMADHLMAKVRADGVSVRTVTVRVRYNDMAEDQCGESLAEPTDLETDLYGRLSVLLRNAWKRRVSLRLVSLKLSNLHAGVFRGELPLERSAQQREARRRLAGVLDALRQERGHRVVMRGHDWAVSERPAEPGPGLADARGEAPSPDAIPSGGVVLPVQPRHRSGDGPGGNPACRVMPPRRGTRVKVRPTPLLVRSHYSFLNSTLSPSAVVALAARHELPAIAMVDEGHLHGAPEFVQAALAAGVQPLVGAEVWVEGRPLRLYVENARGYANLCRLLSEGQERRRWPATVGSGAAVLNDAPMPFGRTLEENEGGGRDLEAADGSRRRRTCAREWLTDTEGLVALAGDPGLAPLFPGRFYLGATSAADWVRMPGADRWPCVALDPVHYAAPGDRRRFDIVQSIRTLTLLGQSHPEKMGPGAFHFPSADEVGVRWAGREAGVERGREIAERCAGFVFPFGPPQFPAWRPPDGSTARDYLRKLVLEGMARRYGDPPPPDRRAQVETELQIIHEVGYEEYFLVVWDILQECRRRGIEWITRGSAADSMVCYCLGISGVCPVRFELYFRRFLNKERMALHKLPDIDVDFPHDRKDDVLDLIFEKYGREHCAVVGGFSTFQWRAAVGDVAKVLGVSEYQIRRFTEHFPWSFGGGWELREPAENGGEPGEGSNRLLELLRASPECRDLPLDEEPYRTAVEMAACLEGVPRYAKMHPCGVVLSRQPMHELTPTFVSGKGYPTTHFDMDAVEAMGLVKIDVLAQGGLSVMRDVVGMLARRGIEVDTERCWARTRVGEVPGGMSGAPLFEDPAVWAMVASGGARAVHHIESPAMTSLCRMTNVGEIDGLIAIVSVIRPGAANEHKKLAFTRRYQKLEPPEYPDPSLEACLRSTFGLVVYEEHILQICEAFAGLNGGRADVLRRALVKRKRQVVREMAGEFAVAARARGHAEARIREVWELVTGFNGYAFCKAHSTAYGVEAYQSAWLKHYFPAQFMAAVLTNGKGFYAPLVYVLECHRLGIPLAPPWVNDPGPAYTVVERDDALPVNSEARSTPGRAIRVPVVRVKGLTTRTADRIVSERASGPFRSVRDFFLRVRPLPEEMEALIRVGALDGFGGSRTGQFWEYRRTHGVFGQKGDPDQGWLLPPGGGGREGGGGECAPDSVPMGLEEPSRSQRLAWEAELLGFPASGHPLELYSGVAWETYCPIDRLGEHVGHEVVTCGLIIEQRVHHQATGEPMKFLTLCDWTGMVETELFAATYRSYGLATVRYPVLELVARVEPFENGRGHTLRVLRAGKPRQRR